MHSGLFRLFEIKKETQWLKLSYKFLVNHEDKPGLSRLTGYFLLCIRSHDVTKSRIIEFWESIYFWVGNRWLWGNNLFSTSDRLLKITLTCHLNSFGLVTPPGKKYSQDLINSYLYFIVIHYILNCSKRKRFKYIFDRCALWKMNLLQNKYTTAYH